MRDGSRGPRSSPRRVVGNMIIDPAAAKGEILGIPLVMGSPAGWP